MSIIDGALSANATIASDYDPDRGKPPAPKIAIVTCADPRLSSIEQMLGLAEADPVTSANPAVGRSGPGAITPETGSTGMPKQREKRS